MFGYGVYSTPDIEIAEHYATEFNHKGLTYKVVMQNRVNPETLKIILFKNNSEYWLNEEERDVRPYGICIKEIH